METLFLKLLNMSISAGWLVIAVLLLRVVFKRAPKFITVILWGLVAVRLVCPFSFESILSLIPSAETVPNDIMYAQTPQIHSGISSINDVVNNVVMPQFYPDHIYSANPLQIVVFIASIVWIVGIAAMLLYMFISYIRIRIKVREAVHFEGNIWYCDHISTPFILGVIKPRIYLPSEMGDEDREYVITHERAHLKRKDHFWKPIGFLLLTIYWFNPVLWAAYIFLCRDIEHACDERVIKELGEENKKTYSYALINCSLNKRLIMVCPLAFGEVNLKNRIKVVLNYKKPVFWVMIVSVILSIAVAVCFLTNPVGIKITELNEPIVYDEMFDDVEGITVTLDEKNHIVTSNEAIEQVITALKAIKLKNDPITERDGDYDIAPNRITIDSYSLCFNKDFTEFWLVKGMEGTHIYRVHDPVIAEMAFVIWDKNKTTAITSEFSGGSDADGLSISIKDIELNTESPYIEIEWKNETDKEYTYGESFDITYKKGDTFSSCATRVLYYHSVGYYLKPNETKTETYDLSDFDLSRNGQYRFETSIYDGIDLWIDFKLENQTEEEMYYSQNEEGTKAVQIKQLREKYPQYFDLPTVDGLEVYVELFTSNPNFPTSANCYLFSGNDLGYEYGDLENLTGVTDTEMKLILSTYQSVASSEINIIAFNHPLSLYQVQINDGYISQLRRKFDIYNEKLDSYPHFKATVLEIKENGTILVEAFENETIRNISAQFTLNVKGVYENTNRPLKAGDKVRIAYNGSIAETFPANITDVRAVVLIDNGDY